MKISAVTAHVKEGFVDEFIAATLRHHANTLKEEGNLRFDFLQSRKDPTHFLFYEVYDSEADIELHRQADSYRTWRSTVEEWMAEPRQGTPYKAIAPQERRMYQYP